MHETIDSRRLSTSKISTRFRFFFAAASTTALALAGVSFTVGGCAADLQKDPSEYTNVVEEGGGAQLPCNLNMLMTQSCWGIGCHGSNTPAAGLDMESPGVEARLLNQPATHRDILNGSQVNCGCTEAMMGATPPYTCPPSTQLLVDGNNPDNSLILKKVNGTHTCGDKMPIPPRAIDASGIACLRAWVFQIAGKDPNSSAPPPMGGSGGMPAAGGGGAGGTGGGGAGGTAGSSGSAGAGGTGGASAGTGGGGTGGI